MLSIGCSRATVATEQFAYEQHQQKNGEYLSLRKSALRVVSFADDRACVGLLAGASAILQRLQAENAIQEEALNVEAMRGESVQSRPHPRARARRPKQIARGLASMSTMFGKLKGR